MALGSNDERVVDAFALQFESDGNANYLYRRRSRGPAIAVSAAERAEFLDDFRRGWKRNKRIMTVAIAVMMVAIVVVSVWLDNSSPVLLYGSLGLGMAGILTWLLLANRTLYRAPTMALAARSPVGRERSAAEAREAMLANVSWKQLLLPLLSFVVMLLAESTRIDMLHGWGRLWLLGGGLAILAVLIRAIRKWQMQIG